MQLLRWVLLLAFLIHAPFEARALDGMLLYDDETSTSSGSEGVLPLGNKYNTVMVEVTISDTATVQFKGSVEGSSPIALACTDISSTSFTTATSTSSTAVYSCPVTGLTAFQAVISAYTDGTVRVYATPSAGSSRRGGGSGGGSGVATSVANSTTLPATCTVGQIYHDTDEDQNLRLNLCVSTDSWVSFLESEVQGLDDVITIERTYGGAVSQGTAVRFGSSVAGEYHVFFRDGVSGLIATCEVAGVLDDCDKNIKVITGRTFNLLDNGGAAKFTFTSSTGALTNVTMDTEGTGNVFTLKRYKWIPVGACQNTTASSILDLPASNPAVAACRTGTNTTKGVLEFADGANALTAQFVEYLNEDWTGAIDATILWQSGSTSTNNVVWQIAIACAGDGESDDPAFTDDVFTADANKGTANQYNATAANTVTTTGTCTAGKLMHIRVKRDPAHASDNFAATAQLIGVALKQREAQ